MTLTIELTPTAAVAEDEPEPEEQQETAELKTAIDDSVASSDSRT